jgi:hypothetical protein
MKSFSAQKLLILFLFVIPVRLALAQYDCLSGQNNGQSDVQQNTESFQASCTDIESYIPGYQNKGPHRVIRVPVHFIILQDANGSSYFTDNYNQDTAMLGHYLRTAINPRFRNNGVNGQGSSAYLNPCPTSNVPDTKIRFIFGKLTYVKDPNYYVLGTPDRGIFNLVGSLPYPRLEIYLTKAPVGQNYWGFGEEIRPLGSSSNVASGLVAAAGPNVIDNSTSNTLGHPTFTYSAELFVHEIGHVLHLPHTFGVGSPCDASRSDFDCSIPDDNYMNYCWGQREYFSPRQIGIMRMSLEANLIAGSNSLGRTDGSLFTEYCTKKAQGELVISSNQVWEKSVNLDQEILRIENNSTLKIKCKVHMPFEGRIEVEKGSELIVDGGAITNDCKWWNGIYLEGTSDQSQTLAHQSKLVLKNGATISSARDAITNIAVDDNGNWIWGTTGAIIHAEDALFLNNRRDLQLLSYQDLLFNGNLFGISISKPYDAHFKNCDFVRNDFYQVDQILPSITGWEVSYFNVEGCQFKNNINNNGTIANYAGEGGAIYTENASYRIHSSNSRNTKIANYYDAVRGLNSHRNLIGSIIDITGVEFYNNTHALYLSGFTFPSVVNNTIKTCPESSGGGGPGGGGGGLGGFNKRSYQSGIYGIYFNGCDQFELKGNILEDCSSSGVSSAGIVVRNAGPNTNVIFDNQIDGFTVGSEAIGRNRNVNDPSKGLKYFCNDFGSNAKNATDIFIPSAPISISGEGISPYQGSWSNQVQDASGLANNLFSANLIGGENNIDNRSPSPVIYHYSTVDPRLEPTKTNGPVVPIRVSHIYNRANACMATDWKSMDIGSVSTEYGDIRSQIIQKEDLREQLLEGNNSASLQAEILFAEDQSDYIDIYIDLLNQSPYVSKEVMLNVLDLSDFPELALRDILVANTHLARDPEIINKILTIEPPISQQTIQDINNEQSTITAYDIINMELSFLRHKDSRLANALVELYTQSNNISSYNEDLNELIMQREETSYHYALVQERIGKDAHLQAQNTLDSIDIRVDLGESGDWHASMVNFYEALIQHPNVQQGNNYPAPVISIMQDIIDNGNGPAVERARAFLFVNGFVEPYAEPLFWPESVPSNKKEVSQMVNRPRFAEKELFIFPNPTESNITVRLNSFNSKDSGVLRIRIVSSSGKVLNVEELNPERLSFKTFSLDGFAKGLYFIEIYQEGTLKFKEKVIKR